MAAQSGTTWALSVRTTASPAAYTAIAGLRTRSFKINNNPVDVTTADSTSRFRELLGDTGTVELEIDAAGLYQKDAPGHLLPSLVASGAATVFQLVSAASTPGITIVGTFVVSEYEASATYNEAATFTVKLLSSGAPTFTYSPTATTAA
ncbi:phage tail tube protein [Caudoviricetes sp.]|nr:phage tail tube protein [Caudoviricetes sp.]UOF81481.1 phage tail tube protein [Caudoviricetes sp.]